MEDKNKANTALSASTPPGRTQSYDEGALSFEPTQLSSGQVPLQPNATLSNPQPAGFGRFVKRFAVVMGVVFLLGIGGIVAGSLLFGDDETGGGNVAQDFTETEIPLTDLPSGEGVELAGGTSLTINGPLRVNDTFVLTPQAQPVQAVAGQMYFDQTTNQLAYYNGTEFVELQGNNVVSVTSGSPNVTVVNDGNGNVTITSSGGGTGTVTSSGGTAGRIAKFTSGQNLQNSLLSESGAVVTVNGDLNVSGGVTLATPLTVANGGIGTNTLAVNGVIVGNGSAALTSVTAGGVGQCLLSTAGAPSFQACPGGGGGANTALSNLASVAINTTLLPGAAGTIHLGSATLPFGDVFLAGTSGTPATNNFRITGASTSGTRTITLPDATGTVCLQTAAACGFATGTGAAFVNGGNSFGGATTLGTNDGNDLAIERGGTTQLTVGSGNVTLASNVDLLMQGTTAFISNPQGQTASEAFGLSASVTASEAVAVGNLAKALTQGAVGIGYNATADGFGSPVAIGENANAGGWSVAIGEGANAPSNFGVALGNNSTSGPDAVALGAGSVADSGGIAIGDSADTGGNDRIVIGRGAAATADRQMVIGGSSATGFINDLYIGSGVTDATPQAIKLNATGGSGTDIAGASLTLAGGRGTGTGNGGNINFQIADPGTSGTGLNALATVASLNGANGALTLQNTTNSANALQMFNAAGIQLLNVNSIHNTSDLITNGSLEINTTGWVAKGSATIARTTSQQYIGLASLQTDTTASGDGAKYNVTLSSSTQYTAQFYAKLSSGTFTNMSLGYASDGSTEVDCKTGQTVKTNGWSVYSCTFTTGTVSGTPYFYWRQNSAVTRTVYVDALQLVPGPDIGAFYEGKIDTGGLIFNGPVAIQNDNNSQAVFQIQSSSGTTVFGADALNFRVGVNLIQPTASLHVTTIGTTSPTALFNQNGSSTEDILQLSKSSDLTTTVTHSGAATFQNLTDSTAAFRILAFNATFGSGVPQFVVDTTNSRAYIGNPTADSTGALLVLDTKNTSGDPTGVLGGMYYNSNRGKMRCFELDQGSSGYWRDCSFSSRTAFRYTNDMLTRVTDNVTEIFGSTSQQSGDTRHPGIVRFTTGGAGTDAGAEGFGVSGDAEVNFLLGNGDIWRYETVARVDDLSTGTQRFTYRTGFNDDMANAEDGVDGCFFRYSDDINGGDWEGVCRSNSTESVCDTNIAVAADTWYRLTVVVNSATSVDFHTDGTTRCSITTNVPTGAGRQTTFMAAIKKEVGATARNVDVDYLTIESEFGTSR